MLGPILYTVYIMTNLPVGEHHNVTFEPNQASNNWSGSWVIGYLYPDGANRRRIEQYRVPVSEHFYRESVKYLKNVREPWEALYRQFRPVQELK